MANTALKVLIGRPRVIRLRPVIYSPAQITLGRLYSQRLKLAERHELLTHEIYKYMRHPYYAGSILSWLGLTLLLNSVLDSP